MRGRQRARLGAGANDATSRVAQSEMVEGSGMWEDPNRSHSHSTLRRASPAHKAATTTAVVPSPFHPERGTATTAMPGCFVGLPFRALV